MTYFAFVPERGRWAEIVVRRENGRTVSRSYTGTIYRTARLAEAGVLAKNLELQKAIA